jgi:penicillin-binding protein 1A
MGVFSSRRKPRRGERAEPQLFAQPPRRGGQKMPPPRRRRSLLGRLVSLALVLSVWGLLAGGAVFGYVWLSLDRKGLLQIPERQPGIMILASDGSVLAEQGAFFGDAVRVSELPDYVPNAVIAIEDRRFRHHFGVDPLGLLRAFVRNASAGRVVEGGSTLTQQLAKNLFLTPDRTYERKLQEVVLAVWLETRFTKNEILQLYLNRVYYGSGAFGIEKAAQTYYGKPARDLSLAEAATLAGLLKAPANYSPTKKPEEAAARAGLVLQSMVRDGFITAEEGRDAIAAPATVVASDYVPATGYVVDWVTEQLPLLVKNYDQSIIIETTLDTGLQAHAEQVLRKRLATDGKKLGVSQGAVVLTDTTGAIKAMVGGRSYKGSQYNRATKAKRQPGSSFKPFVYLAALEQGYSPDSIERDEPVRIGTWEPENYKHKYLGDVSLEKAFALSLNTVAAKLAQAVGPANVVATAHRLGITSALGNDASIALGTSEVTPLEMAAAFTPFANGGAAVQPYAVMRVVTRDGQVLYERSGDGLGQVVTDYDLGAMNRMMRAVVLYGTGTKAAFGTHDIGGKTGTSQDYRDAWFVGFSSYFVGAVWLGNDDNTPTKNVTGGSLPALVWHDIMEQAHQGLAVLPLPGEQLPAGDNGEAIIVSDYGEGADQAYEDENGDVLYVPEQQTRGRKGFLEQIFGGGGGEEPVKKQKKKKRTEFTSQR